MAIIGLNTASTLALSYATTDHPVMMDKLSHLAVANEVVDLVGIYNYTPASSAVVRIGLYQITASGAANNGTLVYSTTITGAPFAVGTWYTKVVSWPLTAGNRYAVSVSVVSGGPLRTSRTVWVGDQSSKDSVTIGSDALPATWTDTAYTYNLPAYASTTVTAGVPTITLSDANGNTDCVDLNGDPFTGQADISVFKGADHASVGTTPDFEGTVDFDVNGEVTIDVSESILITGDDYLLYAAESGTDNRTAYFGTVD